MPRADPLRDGTIAGGAEHAPAPRVAVLGWRLTVAAAARSGQNPAAGLAASAGRDLAGQNRPSFDIRPISGEAIEATVAEAGSLNGAGEFTHNSKIG